MEVTIVAEFGQRAMSGISVSSNRGGAQIDRQWSFHADQIF
jgi:hypothetical protein